MRQLIVVACILGSVSTALVTAQSTRPASAATTQPAEAGNIQGQGSKRIVVEIAATIDGSDELTLSADGAEWTHKNYGWPADILINNVKWDPRDGDLPSTGPLEFLKKVDFSKARVLDRQGRDTVAMEAADDHVTIYFDDAPIGADHYRIRIALPLK
jgi:hypothetical protein